MELIFLISSYDTWNLNYDRNEFIYETEIDVRGQTSGCCGGRRGKDGLRVWD